MREWDNSCSEEEKEKMKLLVEIGMMSYIGKWWCLMRQLSLCYSSSANNSFAHVCMLHV